MSHMLYRVPKPIFFSGEGERFLQILSLRRGANSKQGAYLKLALIRAFTVGLAIAHVSFETWPFHAVCKPSLNVSAWERILLSPSCRTDTKACVALQSSVKVISTSSTSTLS